ncbi:MAG TPA: hypothetical protein VKM55_10095 [Candidatus Lokiarchaeia archaeon]|nr:hypothetical protein [Candidatus Lokiarchaeia archaeon]
MDENLKETLISASASKWRPRYARMLGRRGFYEVWFLLINDLSKKQSYWIRYTLLISGSNDAKADAVNVGEALVWFGFFDQETPSKNFIIKQSHPLSVAKPSGALDREHFNIVAIGESELLLDMAKGTIKTPSQEKTASWNIHFTNFARPYHHVPRIAAMLQLTTTVPVSQPNLRATGEIRVNGDARRIEDVPATQTHIIGKNYADEWAWAHCNAFDTARGEYFEMISRKDRATLGFFDGKKRYYFNKLSSMRHITKEWNLTGITFAAISRDHEIHGNIEVPKEALLGVEYKGPREERMYCYNSEVAYGKIILRIKANDDIPWEEHEFVSSGAFAFETTMLKPVEGMKYLPWDREE